MMIDYSWVPWFRELATKIAQNDEGYLVEKAKEVEWDRSGKNPVPAILRYGDKNIDPLSFLYFLARDRGTEMLHSELKSVHEVFSIAKKRPKSDPYIPRPSGINTLFHYGGVGRPELIWRLFRQAAMELPKISGSYFDDALIKGVKIKKLTQTLFIVNPNYFLPADDCNEVLPWPEFQKKVGSYQEYVARMEAIKQKFPGCDPYEINCFLNEQQRNQLITSDSKVFQISTNVYNDGDDYWEWRNGWEDGDWSFKENHYVYTGDEGGHKKKSLREPDRGDVVLVRKGQHQGYAIGVVEENRYAPDGWKKEEVIHVLWINKTASPIKLGSKQLIGFSQAGKSTRQKFGEAKAYQVSFDLIDRFQKGGEPSSQPNKLDALNTKEVPQDEEGNDSLSLNTILFGPPGTGKTYEAVSHAVAIIDGKDPSELAKPDERNAVKNRFRQLKGLGQIEFVTFHQNYAYEDFIEGIRPVLNRSELSYKLHKGIFKKICQRACNSPDQKYLLIIDEINRGFIDKIFGELITLVEPSKRLDREDATEVRLQYSQKLFGVPCNLYILGTMNTADRGITQLDTALRRRFDFIEMMPNPELVEGDIEGVNGKDLLVAINRRIKAKLDREHQIGHTYLIDVKTIDDLATVFQHRILPLLQEYFYDDWEKICSVLNSGVEDGHKSNNLNPFIRKDPSESSGDDADRPGFELLPHDDDKWHEAESYRQIYAPAGKQEGNDGG